MLDNLKEGVLKPDLYEPELNPVYAATLAHYGVVADPARVRDPNRKGTVENAIGHTQATALKGRRFETIEEQNAFLEHWETQVGGLAHPRQRSAARCRPCSRRSAPHLQPLPLQGMQYFTECAAHRLRRQLRARGPQQLCGPAGAHRHPGAGAPVRAPHRDPRPQTQALLRTHPRAERPGTVVLPDDERVFNPSRETRRILRQAEAIGADAARLCQLLFAIEGRVGQRKLWGIVQPGRALSAPPGRQRLRPGPEDGVHSYSHVKTLTERLRGRGAGADRSADATPGRANWP